MGFREGPPGGAAGPLPQGPGLAPGRLGGSCLKRVSTLHSAQCSSSPPGPAPLGPCPENSREPAAPTGGPPHAWGPGAAGGGWGTSGPYRASSRGRGRTAGARARPGPACQQAWPLGAVCSVSTRLQARSQGTATSDIGHLSPSEHWSAGGWGLGARRASCLEGVLGGCHLLLPCPSRTGSESGRQTPQSPH